jgi:hypothetical protein
MKAPAVSGESADWMARSEFVDPHADLANAFGKVDVLQRCRSNDRLIMFRKYIIFVVYDRERIHNF